MSDLPPKLDYQTPQAEESTSTFAGYAACTTLLTIGVVAILLMSTITIGRRPVRSDYTYVWVIGAAYLLLINAIAFWLYRRRNTRTQALGIWIGLAIAALIEGMCFVSLH